MMTQTSVRQVAPTFSAYKPQPAPVFFSVVVPKSTVDGQFLTVNQDELSKATNSVKLSEFCNVGIDQQEFNATKSERKDPCTVNKC